MKRFSFLVLLAVLLVSDYAFAQIPSCPCDTLELSNGTTGNDIIELLCPGGKIGEDAGFELDETSVSIFDGNSGYEVEISDEVAVCGIAQKGGGVDLEKLKFDTAQTCIDSLIARCGLNNRNIPTLSEWGLIAMAGLMGVAGLLVAARRRKAAA